jgi:predicted nucleic acid-binding protein
MARHPSGAGLFLRTTNPPCGPDCLASLVLQELPQGFAGAKSRDQIVERFSALPLIAPDREDHIRAATLRNQWRRAGVQIGTIDALLAQLCLRHHLIMLTADHDFRRIAKHASLRA